MTDPMKTNLRLMEQKPQQPLPRLEIDPTGGKQTGVDYAGTLNRLAREAQQHQQQARPANASTLLVAEEGAFHLQAVSTTFGGFETPTDRKLKQVTEWIHQEEYAKALDLVAEILAEQPSHPEAIFLAATCEHGLGRNEPALQRLYKLRTSGTTSAMLGRIKRLCEKIRDVMTPGLFAESQAAMAQGPHQVQAAIARVQSLVKLDPDAAMHHYLLTIMYLMNGQEDQAYRSCETAVAVGRPHETAKLLALQNDICERIAERQMLPAVALFKQGKFKEARKELGRLDDAAQKAKLWSHFDGFLAQCAAGKAGDAPQLDYADAEPMYEFLLMEELALIRNAMAIGRADVAERTAKAAVRWVPHYYYIHFQCGHAIYCRLGDQLGTNSPPTLEQLLEGMRESVKHARQASKDPEIKAAALLAQTVQELIDLFEEQVRESGIVNPVIEEFLNIMDSAKTGISSMEELRRARSGLQGVKSKIALANKKVESKPAREALKELAEAIDVHLGQLADIEKSFAESEILDKLISRFTTLMEGLEKSGGVKSVDDLNRVESQLNSIKSDIPSVRSKLKTQRSKDELKQLEQAVNQHLGGIRNAADSIREGEMIDPLIKQFTTITDGLTKAGGISSPSEARTLKGVFQTLKKNCENKKSQLKSADARKALDDLIQAINSVLAQLAGF